MPELFLFLTSSSTPRLPSSSPSSSSPLPATTVDDDETNLSSKYVSASLNIFFLAPIGSVLYAKTNLGRLLSSVSSLVDVLLRAFNIVVALKRMSRFNAFVDCTCTLVHSSSFFILVSIAKVPGLSSSSDESLVFERNASTFSSSSAGRAIHRTPESSSSSSSKKPQPSSSLNDDGEDFKRRRLFFFREEEVKEEGKGARRRGAQRRIFSTMTMSRRRA